MTVSASQLELVTELFADLRGVSTRRMFGGAGVYAQGVMFALVDDDVIYLKVDDALRAERGRGNGGERELQPHTLRCHSRHAARGRAGARTRRPHRALTRRCRRHRRRRTFSARG